MGKIKQMKTSLANQIAAGEVVERPASVVKELCENAIDAGASQVLIDIKEAGIQSIKIVDDGHGMDQEDLNHCILAHATSKIFTVHDLFQVTSLGFRGEALASIASVAKLRIESTLNLSDQPSYKGHYIEVENAEIIEQGTCPPKPGTSIEVKSLFYNTPARLKHLASLQTELRHINQVVQNLAVAYPDIRFQLISDGQVQIQTMGRGDLRQSLAQVYNPSLARQLLAVQAENTDFSLKGYISPASLTRTSRHYIHWIVNGRTVKNYALSNVLIKAYGKKLMIGRFPLAFIEIDLDPRLVDVNVHPTKQTIRLSKEDDLCHLLEQAVQEALGQGPLIPTAGQTLFKTSQSPKKSSEHFELDLNSALYQDVNVLQKTGRASSDQRDRVAESLPPFQEPVRDLGQEENIQENQKEESQSLPQRVGVDFASLRYVGQIHGTYLVAEGDESFYLIDQHAAQERIRYEALMADKVEIQLQTLLMPQIYQFDSVMMKLTEEYGYRLEELGIHLEPFGPTSYQLTAYPTWMDPADLGHLIPDLLERLGQNELPTINQLKEASLIMQSCRGAIKANQYLSNREAESLICQLTDLEDPYHCPHGRPVFVEFDPSTIEKLFKRIQDPHQGGRSYG